MPELGQLSCSIELGRLNSKLKEYAVTYGNKRVSCLVCAPQDDVNFSIHLTSNGYIAPGLAMFIYIDGQYQCNRNRTHLAILDDGTGGEIDFRARQKEEPQTDGSFMMGRSWKFAPMKIVSPEKASNIDSTVLNNLGLIEVVVLRCKANTNVRGRDSATDLRNATSQKTQTEVPIRSERPKENKAASVAASELGGLFGLFDGTNEQPRDVSNTSGGCVEKDAKDARGMDCNLDGASDTKARFEKLRGGIETTSKSFHIDRSGDDTKKAYYNDWNITTINIAPKRILRDPYIAPAYDLPDICANFAASKGLQVQVQTGRGAKYWHRTDRPEYLDTMDSPYAMFKFHYRTQSVLEQTLKTRLPDEKKASAEAMVKSMNRAELEQEYLRLKENSHERNEKNTYANRAKHLGRHSMASTSSAATVSKRASTPPAVDKVASWIKDGNVKAATWDKNSNKGEAGWGNDDQKAKSVGGKSDKKPGSQWGDKDKKGDTGGWDNEKKSEADKASQKKASVRSVKQGASFKDQGWGEKPAEPVNADVAW